MSLSSGQALYSLHSAMQALSLSTMLQVVLLVPLLLRLLLYSCAALYLESLRVSYFALPLVRHLSYLRIQQVIPHSLHSLKLPSIFYFSSLSPSTFLTFCIHLVYASFVLGVCTLSEFYLNFTTKKRQSLRLSFSFLIIHQASRLCLHRFVGLAQPSFLLVETACHTQGMLLRWCLMPLQKQHNLVSP